MDLFPLSKSKYGVFLFCPWKAHALKNLGLEDRSGPAAEIGTEFHSLREQIDNGEITLEQAKELTPNDEVREFLELAEIYWPYEPDENRQCELHVHADKNGKLTTADSGKSMIHGLMDIVEQGENEILVADWKTGRWEKDSEVERHFYAGILAHAAFPEWDRIRFQLRFIRSGRILESTYTWSDKGKTVTVVEPSGKAKVYADKKGGLVAWFGTIISTIKQTEPLPKPGKHCKSWFGQPCHFAGFQCPLAAKLPTVTQVMMPDYRENWEALLLMKDHPDTVFDPAIVGRAMLALDQLAPGLKAVKANIEKWALDNGRFSTGTATYGWHEKSTNEVDAVFALEQLFEAGLEIEEIAKVVNVSKTSLSKLSKKNYPELREMLLDMAVTPTPKAVFGEVTGEMEYAE